MTSREIRKREAQKPATRTAAHVDVATTLPEAMTGRASPAKAAVGDKPVFAYIASLPQPQRGIAETVDALAAKTLPDLQRSVKWGMSYYGVGDTGGDGQVDARCGARIHGRHRRTPDRGVDETSRVRARCWREEALNPRLAA
jgi:hypothetical protein